MSDGSESASRVPGEPVEAAPLHWPGALGALGLALTSAVAVYLTARLAYGLFVRGIVVVWFPAGTQLALLLVFRKRSWPPILVGAFLGNMMIDLATTGIPGFALMAPVANLAEGVVAALVVRRLTAHADLSRSVEGIVALVVGAATASNAATALLGASVLVYWYGSAFGRSWAIWWVGDGLGMIVVTPALLGAVAKLRELRGRGARPAPDASRLAEAGLLLGLVVLVTHALFGLPADAGYDIARALSIVPLLIWAALRLGPLVTAVAVGVVTVLTLWHSAAGRGPLVEPTLSSLDQAVELYAFVAVASFSVLALAAVIAERAEAAGRVRDSEARYRAVVDAARDAIVTVDRSGRVLFCNDAVEAIVGVPARELSGRSVLELLPEDRRESLSGVLHRYVSGELANPSHAFEVEVLHRDGRRIPAEIVFGEWVQDEERRLTGIARDVSERRRLEAHLRHAQKLEGLGHLTAGVAHEFRNQLLVIQANLDLASIEVGGSEDELRRSLEGIQAAVQRSTSTVEGLLAFGRRQPLSPVLLDLDELVVHGVKTVEPLLDGAVRIEVSRSDEKKLVRADPAALQQSLLNLLLNARDAMPQGGVLRIDSGTAALDEPLRKQLALPAGDRFVTLDVSDTGTGMEPDVLARIFEPFFSTKRQGTGLGLAAVYGTVRQSGGAVQAESTPGEGTRFRVYLPSVDS